MSRPAGHPAFHSLAEDVQSRLTGNKYVESAVNRILQGALVSDASDILLEPVREEVLLKYRINGRFFPVTRLPLEHAIRILGRVKVMAGIPVYIHGLALDGRLEMADDTGRKVEMRVSTVPAVHGERVVIRVLDPDRLLRPIDQLGLEASIVSRLEELVRNDQGLLLICGATSSGKTTTLYALLNHIADTQADTRQIISIEDPVEFPLDGIAQLEVNESSGFGFDQAVKAVLRQDPEVIGIGEVRDPETARMAVRAALTGHLVMGTLHAGSTMEATARLRELGADRRLLAGAITAILHQTLEPVSCACRDAAGKPDPACRRCLATGVSGRRANGDLLEPDTGFRNRILQRAEFREDVS